MLRHLALTVLATLAPSPLLSQPAPLTVCIVQTKPDAATQYEPSAGPWAVEIDKQLSRQKLRSGAPLQLTALAASTEKEVRSEVQRLKCPWVVQLWYQHSPDLNLSQSEISADGDPPFDSQLGSPAPLGHDDSVFFSLWNGATGKVIANGAAPLRLFESQPGLPPNPLRANPTTCRALTQQIIKRLNKLP